MDATPPPRPSDAGKDFVVVEDSGDFSYYRSREALLADFEYVGEAPCIIDRSATTYRLELDENRHLRLGPPLGSVEFHWLRQALAEARDVHPESHRLQRVDPAGLAGLVAGLFETLQLERGTDAELGLWSLDIDGLATRRNALADVDRLLAGNDRLESVLVTDPFGHQYRPVWHPKHRHLGHAGFLSYVEVPVRRWPRG
ncbi:hypothetical protein SAMN05660473_00111 [Arthrobacter sp. 49Tsu3.1M3]|jgi:hypothetical protein|uniref:hypothetical protein n=1 Tax=Arthrobacter sp. 49Tsu3.1M3 TaxID=1279029 RepID=UPI0009A76601|nr:hypothetical protein [Arthrobacter sp. 49Tsu3.1M3]SKB32611.1 hypothetical protein SAMN05660473_00111 [Arthrobacter sp. 49Tsu3.1M3]